MKRKVLEALLFVGLGLLAGVGLFKLLGIF